MFEDFDDQDDLDIRGVLADAPRHLYLPKGYLSYSQINLYNNCGERYRRTYVLDNRPPGSSNMAHGRLIHKILEEMLLHKRDKGLPPKEFHHDKYSSLAEEYFEEVEVWDPKIPNMEVAEKASRELLDIYYDKRLPEVFVRDVELKIQTQLRGYIPFIGYVDLVERDLEAEALAPSISKDTTSVQSTDIVRDTKVTGRTYGKSRVENSLQLSLYSVALGVDKVGYDLLVQKKRSEFVSQSATRSKEEKKHALDVVEDVAQSISRGVFRRADPEHWMCSKKWCPFWGECRGRKL